MSLARVVSYDRMRLAIQRADARRMIALSIGPSKQAACCSKCIALIREGEDCALDHITGKAWCSTCWRTKP